MRHTKPQQQPREYYIEAAGRSFPRTSTILGLLSKPALVPWAAKCVIQRLEETLLPRIDMGDISPGEILTILQEARVAHRDQSIEALVTGGNVHEAIEKYLFGGLKPTFKKGTTEYSSWMAWKRFVAEHELIPEFIEERVWSEAGGGYTTQPDFVGRLDRKYTVIDWKTSAAVYMPEHPMQLASQWKAVADTYFDGAEAVIEQMAILRLPKDRRKYELKIFPAEVYPRHLAAFVKLTELWYALQAI